MLCRRLARPHRLQIEDPSSTSFTVTAPPAKRSPIPLRAHEPVPAKQWVRIAGGAPGALNDSVYAIGLQFPDPGESRAQFPAERLACSANGVASRAGRAKPLFEGKKMAAALFRSMRRRSAIQFPSRHQRCPERAGNVSWLVQRHLAEVGAACSHKPKHAPVSAHKPVLANQAIGKIEGIVSARKD